MKPVHQTLSLLQRGGIFLQLFVGLWIALFGIGLFVWFASQSYQQVPLHFGDVEASPGARRGIHTAVNIWRWGGETALVKWLSDPESNLRPEVFVLTPEGEELSGRKVPETALKSVLDNRSDRYIVRPCRHAGKRAVCRDLRFFAVRTDLPPRNFFAALWHTPLWMHVLFAVLATSFAAGLLAWNFSRPIRKLNWAMKRASEGDLAVRIAPEVRHKYDEIGALAEQYDAMAEKINGLLARQKRLFHDVSHELRSPLARMEVAVALAAKNPDRAPEFLKRIEKDVHSLDALVEELLTYARLDDNAPMVFEDTDAVLLLEDIADNVRFEGSQKRIVVTLEAPDHAVLRLNTDHFARAVENILRNALRYTPPGGTVRIRATPTDKAFVIAITDEGPGMKSEEIEKLFQPFVRGSTEATGTGFGLGLAIAKRAVQRHGGTLTAENARPHGLTMTLRLPYAGPGKTA